MSTLTITTDAGERVTIQISGPGPAPLELLATAKGDLLVASAPGVLARLGVGSNGQVPTADSAQPTGVKWADPAGVVTRAAMAAAIVIDIDDINDPRAELAQITPAGNGEFVFAHAGSGNWTLYVSDAAGPSTDTVYAVPSGSSDFIWIAFAGAFIRRTTSFQQALAVNDNLIANGPAVFNQGYAVARKVVNGYTVTNGDYELDVDASSAPCSVILPTAGIPDGKRFLVRKIDASANAVTVVGVIDGVGSPTITAQYGRKHVTFNGTDYYSVS